VLKGIYPIYRKFSPEEVREIRRRYGESRRLFSRHFLASEHTVKNWETGHRELSGSAIVILQQLNQRLVDKDEGLRKGMSSREEAIAKIPPWYGESLDTK